MKCKLCDNEYEKLAKSHILPIGFFASIPTKGRLNSISFKGNRGRKLQKAIYDKTILCSVCEQELAVLDDYAIKIFRDKINSFEVSHFSLPNDKFIIFEDTDSNKLRAFLASILWRISVSKQKEICNLSIGSTYENRIKSDLRSNGVFAYIDVNVYFYTHKFHSAIFSPFKIKIQPLDKKRDTQVVNGWEVQLPYIALRISLDKRPHPEIAYINFEPEQTNKLYNVQASSSLNAGENYKFMCFQTTERETVLKKMFEVVKNKKV